MLDVSGYFIAEVPVPPTYTFFPITPCRVVDTRINNGSSFGAPSLVTGQPRAFVLSLSSCNLPTAPEDAGGAFSVNVTVVPKGGKPVGSVTVWGTSVQETETPPTSTVNAGSGAVTANAAIITVNPATGGSLSVYATDDTDLVVDVNGYFALSQLVPGGLSLYTLPPCRILDTRPSGEFSGPRTVTVTTGNNCSVSGAAKAYVLNATVVPPQPVGSLTLWKMARLNHCFNSQRGGWVYYFEYGDRRNYERVDRCIRYADNAAGPGYLRLFCAIGSYESRTGQCCLIPFPQNGISGNLRGGVPAGFYRKCDFPGISGITAGLSISCPREANLSIKT